MRYVVNRRQLETTQNFRCSRSMVELERDYGPNGVSEFLICTYRVPRLQDGDEVDEW